MPLRDRAATFLSGQQARAIMRTGSPVDELVAFVESEIARASAAPAPTEADISAVLTGMMARVEAEQATLSEDEIRSRWFFRFDPEKSLRWNFYTFFDMLHLYRGSCRRWEEAHNGSCCVVERVRDKYLVPKIDEFIGQLGLGAEDGKTAPTAGKT